MALGCLKKKLHFPPSSSWQILLKWTIATWNNFGKPVYTWSPNDLNFWRSTPQITWLFPTKTRVILVLGTFTVFFQGILRYPQPNSLQAPQQSHFMKCLATQTITEVRVPLYHTLGNRHVLQLFSFYFAYPPKILVQWKMGVSPIGSLLFQLSRHFPLNHDCGRKSILDLPPTQDSSHQQDCYIFSWGIPT